VQRFKSWTSPSMREWWYTLEREVWWQPSPPYPNTFTTDRQTRQVDTQTDMKQAVALSREISPSRKHYRHGLYIYISFLSRQLCKQYLTSKQYFLYIQGFFLCWCDFFVSMTQASPSINANMCLQIQLKYRPRGKRDVCVGFFLGGRIIAVYFEKHTKHTRRLCGEDAEFLNVEARGTYSYLCALTR
jgi:hypothetical protein